MAFFTVNTLVAKCRLDLEFAAIEFLWIYFRIKHLDVLCGVCYRTVLPLIIPLHIFSWFVIIYRLSQA